jgi:hypothetical protein
MTDEDLAPDGYREPQHATVLAYFTEAVRGFDDEDHDEEFPEYASIHRFTATGFGVEEGHVLFHLDDEVQCRWPINKIERVEWFDMRRREDGSPWDDPESFELIPSAEPDDGFTAQYENAPADLREAIGERVNVLDDGGDTDLAMIGMCAQIISSLVQRLDVPVDELLADPDSRVVATRSIAAASAPDLWWVTADGVRHERHGPSTTSP